MGRIKGWKKTFEKTYALGKEEEWQNTHNDHIVNIKGTIGRYGSSDFRLYITNKKDIISSDRISLKSKAMKYMRSHPNG